MITTAKDVTGKLACKVRIEQGESQRVFWERFGVTKGTGWLYENESYEIPKTVKELFFIKYIAGINFNATTVDGAKQLRKLGQLAKQHNML